MRWPLFALVALGACSPAINVGNQGTSEEQDCVPVIAAPTVCPDGPWGAQISFGAVEDLEERLIGRWAFCGGEQRYGGRGAIPGLTHGAGIEFWNESGQLRYAFLRGPTDRLARTDNPGGSGSVTLSLDDSGRGAAVLHADDGFDATWTVDFFADAPVLQNAAFDVWSFVPLQ